MKQQKKLCKRFFTLTELVVVIVILAILASVATPIYFRYVADARVSKAKTQIKMLDQALEMFKIDTGKYPETSDGLRALMENIHQEDKWKGPYLKPAVPKDPWGNDYVYVSPGEHGDYDLSSYGADGQPGGEGENGDINNWDVQ